METCSLFDDRNAIRSAWVSAMTSEQIFHCHKNQRLINEIDETVKETFKKLLTDNAKQIKLGELSIAEVLETSAKSTVNKLNF